MRRLSGFNSSAAPLTSINKGTFDRIPDKLKAILNTHMVLIDWGNSADENVCHASSVTNKGDKVLVVVVASAISSSKDTYTGEVRVHCDDAVLATNLVEVIKLKLS